MRLRNSAKAGEDMPFTFSEFFLWQFCGALLGGLLFIYSLDKSTKSSGGLQVFWGVIAFIGIVIAINMVTSIIYSPAPISEAQLNCMNSVIHQNISISTEEAARMCPL